MEKKFISILVFCLLFLPSSVHAETVTAGVSPDNPLLWRIEIFLDDVNAAITSNSGVKVEKMLGHAIERVAEMEKMLRWNKTSAAEEAVEKHARTIEKVKEKIGSLEKESTEKEFEAEIIIETALEKYSASVTIILSTIYSTDYSPEQSSVSTEFITQHIEILLLLTDAVKEKKEATKLKFKANGMSDADIMVLEENLKARKEVTEAIKATGAATKVSEKIVENIADAVGTEEAIEKAKEVVETVSTIVTDTTASSKVKIDGDVTPEQMQLINLLYEQLRADNTEAEIEITISRMGNGFWKIEKEIDGTLTALQEDQLDNLLFLLNKEPSTVKIKVKYDFRDTSAGSDIIVGESDSGLTTAFVIG